MIVLFEELGDFRPLLAMMHEFLDDRRSPDLCILACENCAEGQVDVLVVRHLVVLFCHCDLCPYIDNMQEMKGEIDEKWKDSCDVLVPICQNIQVHDHSLYLFT